MKALRRSMKGEKNERTHISIAPKAATAIVPPKMVIRALYDYEAQSTQELGFSKGDFFHVIGRENDEDWFEACNPAVPDARGLVPVKYFQRLGKTERDSDQSISNSNGKLPDHDSGYAEGTNPAPAQAPLSASQDPQRMAKTMSNSSKGGSSGGSGGPMVYGVVMFDFAAERPDELEAKAGEAIIVIAQSNPEWFVAKPIGRLGGPGLIPVSFIEIRDMVTGKAVPDAQEAVTRAGVPKVEEWKKMAANYKASSIALGKFETPTGQQQQQQQQQQQGLAQGMGRMSLQNAPRQSQQSQQNGGQMMNGRSQGGFQGVTDDDVQDFYPYTLWLVKSNYIKTHPAPPSVPVVAQISEFTPKEPHAFIIEARHANGKIYKLYRIYENFYKFQVMLKEQFPVEAGGSDGVGRTLPYMPGPLKEVTTEVTQGRMPNLDAYVKNLLVLPPHIAEHFIVTSFFSPQNQFDEMIYDEGQNSGYSEDRNSGEGSPERAQMNGGGYGGLSAAPQQQQQYGQQNNGYAVGNPYGSPNSSQDLSLSQSQASGGMQGGAQSSAMKVKVYYGEDLIAIRVPTDILFQQLYSKICDRLKIPPGEEIAMFYKDESSGERPSLMSNNDLDFALSRNDKLVIYVNELN